MVKIENMVKNVNFKHKVVCVHTDVYAYVCVHVHLQGHEQRRTSDRPCPITFYFIPLSQCLSVTLELLKFG